MKKYSLLKDNHSNLLLILAGLMLSPASWAADTVSGTVLTPSASPIANVVVSDGFSVVTTDSTGTYSMPYNPASDYVFVSVPAGYDIPTTPTGSMAIYQQIAKGSGEHLHHFTLTPQPDEGAADLNHVLLVFGDPQVLDDYNVWRFKNETAEDVLKLKASYPQGTKFYGLCVGDVVWDEYNYFPTQKSIFEYMGIKTMVAIGNHDHNCGAAKQPSTDIQDSVAALKFQAAFGPTYYSLNIGAIHYVILDDVYYTGNKTDGKEYNCKITQRQWDWLEKDIEQLEDGTPVVLAMHIPGSGLGSSLSTLMNILRPLGSKNHLMTGHSHTNYVTVHSARFIEHTIAATEGAFWCSDLCSDGSPNGYEVFETSKKGIASWYYKGTGLPREERIRTYPLHSIDAGNSKASSVLANIWDYDEDCSVTILENGKEHIMRQFTGMDPKTWDVMMEEGDTRPNYPGSQGGTIASKNPGTVSTSHLFYYTPTDENADLQVVFTDRFGNTSTKAVQRHMMVASFNQENDEWTYHQDFNTLPHYPNYVSPQKVARGTYIAGHTPEGWYSATSQDVMPSDTTKPIWTGFNYVYINNGSQTNGWCYSYGDGNPNVVTSHSPERALGSLNTDAHMRISHGVLLENTTAKTITSLKVTYTGEVWRVGTYTKAKENIHFRYAVLTDQQARDIRDRKAWIGEIKGTNVQDLLFTTPNNITAKDESLNKCAIDGNNERNRATLSASFDVTIQPGQVVLLRWDDDREENGDDQALAIDDVSVVATTAGTDIVNPLMDENGLSKPRKVMIHGQVYILRDNKFYNILGLTY